MQTFSMLFRCFNIGCACQSLYVDKKRTSSKVRLNAIFSNALQMFQYCQSLSVDEKRTSCYRHRWWSAYLNLFLNVLVKLCTLTRRGQAPLYAVVIGGGPFYPLYDYGKILCNLFQSSSSVSILYVLVKLCPLTKRGQVQRYFQCKLFQCSSDVSISDVPVNHCTLTRI